MTEIETRTIEARTHGRYLVRPPHVGGPSPLLVGFHGYRENAASHMAMLTRIAGTEGWLIVAVQGLHRFYTKGGDVVASWMTREDRELAIADNVAYVAQVIDAVRAEFAAGDVLVFAGFSQGTAMAFRAAGQLRASALIVAGGDVPADVAAGTPVPLPPVLYRTRPARRVVYRRAACQGRGNPRGSRRDRRKHHLRWRARHGAGIPGRGRPDTRQGLCLLKERCAGVDCPHGPIVPNRKLLEPHRC